jgi:malate dehydrogenase (oxaloacetate-decarboxylating)(NADP+)
VLKPEWVKLMAERPLILALANPEPEILPELVKEVRPDAVMATGRSDYPNQVNNVLCFPFIFRGALDVGATTINRDMEIAAVNAIAALAQAEQSDIVAVAYGEQDLKFGPDYLIPRPFDPRLIGHVAPAVAKAAMDSGVATRPITDFEAYKERLNRFVYQSGHIMRSVFAAAKKSPKRVVYAEGEEERFLRAAQQVVDEGIARPVLIGRPDVIRTRIERLGLRLQRDQHYEIVDPNNDPRYRDYWTEYHRLTRRKGISVELAKLDMRRRPTLIGAMLVHMGDADAMLCGIFGQYGHHLRTIDQVIGRRTGVNHYAAMNTLILPKGTVFICDTYVTFDPTAEQIAESTVLAAEEIRRFGVTPKAAMLSHSSFGGGDSVTAQKMRRALELAMQLDPNLEIEGEMQGDMALSEEIRRRALPDNRLKGVANLLVMPNLDAANISFNLLKTASGDGITIGPILLGAAKPAHIVTPSSTVRRIVNMTALSVVDAGAQRGEQKPLI